MSALLADDDSQRKVLRRKCNPQRLTQAVVIGSVIGVFLTLLWIAWPQLLAGDDFAMYAHLDVGDTMHEAELEFDCAKLDTLKSQLHTADELWTDNVFRVVQFQVDSADGAPRQFAFKHVHATPTGKLNAHSKARPALPEHLKKPVHYLSPDEQHELMEHFDAEAHARLAVQTSPPLPAQPVDKLDALRQARQSQLSFNRRPMRRRGGKGDALLDGEDDDVEPGSGRRLLAVARSPFDAAAVSKAAVETLISESLVLTRIANGHPNLPHFRGGCFDEGGVIGSVFELGPFVGRHEPLLRFLQSGVPWCVSLHVAIQVLFTVQHLARPGPLRPCKLLPAHFTVSENALLLLRNVDEVMGANLAADPHDRVTGELHCDAGLQFGRPADEPGQGTHVTSFLAGALLRMMTRRSADLKPFLTLVANRLLAKNFVQRLKLDAAIAALVADYNGAGGPQCRADWLAQKRADEAEAEAEAEEEDDAFEPDTGE